LTKSIVKNFEGFNHPVQQNAGHQYNSLIKKYAQSILTLTKCLSSKSQALNELNSVYVSQKLNKNSNYILSTSTTIEEISFNLNKLLSSKPNTFSSQFSEIEAQSNCEILIGDLLDLATNISPNLAKTWFSYANWCYKFGKKNSETINFNNTATRTEEDEQNSLVSFNNLPDHTSSEEKDYIKSLLSENSLNNKFDDASMADMHVLITNNCRSLSAENIDEIIREWKQMINRVNYFYRLACKSYFTYLKLNQRVYFSFFERTLLFSEFLE